MSHHCSVCTVRGISILAHHIALILIQPWYNQLNQTSWSELVNQVNQPSWSELVNQGRPAELVWTGQPGKPAELVWTGQPGKPAELVWTGQLAKPAELVWTGQPGKPAKLVRTGQPGKPCRAGRWCELVNLLPAVSKPSLNCFFSAAYSSSFMLYSVCVFELNWPLSEEDPVSAVKNGLWSQMISFSGTYRLKNLVGFISDNRGALHAHEVLILTPLFKFCFNNFK